MCELFTIGTATVTVMQAVAAAGAVMTAVSAVQSGQAQKKASDYNAQVAENDAIARKQSAAFEETRLRERQRQAMGMARANAAASGNTMEGSALDLMAQSAQNAELDALAILYSGQVGANASRSQAAADRLQGGMAQTAGYMQAGTTLLTTTGQLGSRWFPSKPAAPPTGMINTDVGYGPMRIKPASSFGG